MRVTVQRVVAARVEDIDGRNEPQEIEQGYVLLVGFASSDTEEDVSRMSSKVLKLRIFDDDNNKMNKAIEDISGEILLIPNFTLCANTNEGNRPSFSSALEPRKAEKLFDYMVETIKGKYKRVKSGFFGASMNVTIVNNGPVTFVIDSKEN